MGEEEQKPVRTREPVQDELGLIPIREAVGRVLDDLIEREHTVETSSPDYPATKQAKLDELSRIQALKDQRASLREEFLQTHDPSVRNREDELGKEIFAAEESLRDPTTPY